MRLIDADDLRAVKFHALPYTHIHPVGAEPYSYELGWNDAIDAIIDSADTVDAEPIVRCKDCKYSEPKKQAEKHHCRWWYRSVNTKDFCSRGERKDNE